MKLILCGGGSREQNSIANEKLNEIIDNKKPLLYVPLAIDEENYSYDDCYIWIKEELINVNLLGIEMVKTFEDLASKKLYDYCALFIGGGNTYKLLKGLKETGAFNKIKDYILNDGVVIGGSAGAVIFGNNIDVISSMDSNIVNLLDTKGFNVLDGISIFPHYTNIKLKLTEEQNKKRLNKFTESISNFSYNNKVIAIPEEDAIYVNGENIEIIGTLPYFIFENGNMYKFEIDDKKQILVKS